MKKTTMTYDNTSTRIHPKKILIIFTVIVAISLFSWYGFFQARALIFGPIITIESPNDGMITDDGMIIVRGTAENITSITMNGFPITISPEGEFIERLPVTGRYTVIEIEGTDRFGSSHTVSRRVLSSMERVTALERDVAEEIELLELDYEEREGDGEESEEDVHPPQEEEEFEVASQEEIAEIMENHAEFYQQDERDSHSEVEE